MKKYNKIYMIGKIILTIILGVLFASNHKYDMVDYNCFNYSCDFSKVLDSYNITNKVICGYSHDYTKGHCWVRVYYNNTIFDIEPQVGLVVDYSRLYSREIDDINCSIDYN